MLILNFINRLVELFQDIGSEVKDTIQDYRDNKLFDVDYSDDTLKFIDEKNLSLEELKELVQQKELKQISQLISSELTNLASNGSINIETYEKMQAVVEGGLTLDSLKELQKLASEVNQPQVNETYTDSTEIAQKIDELDVKQKNFISQNVGDNSKISSLEILDNGSYRLKTSDNSTLVFHETGEMTIAYDDSQKAGFDLYDSDSRLKSSFYIDRLKNDVLVHESYQYNEDGSYVEKIDTSDNPKIQKIVSVDSDSKISNVEILNRETGEVTQDLEFSQTLNPEDGSDADGVGDNSDISDLEQEKEEVQEDLEENIEDKEQTEEEKENELGEIDDEISQGEDNLDDANSDLSDQQDNVDNAQDDLDDANDNLDDAQGDLDESQDNLDDANSDVEDAQSNQEAASQDNETARREEQQAQTSANNATSSYDQATQQTTTAQENKDDTAADVVEAQATTQAAFNVKTQLDQEVAAAQNEYQTAKAQDAGEDKSLWARFKNWVSSAWNSLCNLITKRDKAEIELEKAQKEQERKEVIDEQAAQELERRHEEQDTAQSVMEAAYVVLEAKAGAREVSDQELADALLDLADAMMARDGAIAEHDGALNAFMEANNYKTDAEGNLINEQGELVSCQEIVAGLEEFIVTLNATKQDTEAQYNETLDATIAAISGDYEKLQELEQQILALQENIAQERQELALQEQLLFQLAADKGALISAEDNCAIGDDIAGWFGGGNKDDRERYEANRALLEEAILSGDPKKLEEAYKAIYGDQEVYVDAAGNVVDIMSLSPEQQAACTPVKLSELSGANLTALCQQEQANAYNAQVAVEYLDAGYFTVDGQTISQQELNEALIKQAEEQIAELERAIDGQGWFSTSVGFINRGLGIGTTSDEARAQVEHYKAMVQQLETCTDPVQYAALYKAITGKSFSPNEVVTLCAYREMSGMPPASSNQTKTGNLIPPESQYDLSADIDNVINIVNTECGGDKKALSVTGNSKASQAINDYKETQENIVNGAKGMIVGLVATAVAIVAAPFTGGASLVLLCAAAGAGTSVLIGATDSIYDGDGDGKTDFNYTLGEFGTDLFSGALTGAVSALTLGMGDKLTGALTSKISGTVATTGGQALKQTAARVGVKFLGEAVEGAVDGGLSSAGEYAIEALADGTFNVGDMLKAGAQGAAMGGVLGGGLGAAGELFSSGKHFIDGFNIKADVDNVFSSGRLVDGVLNVDPEDLTFVDVVASKIDPKYIDDAGVNPWALSEISQQTNAAQKALKSAGLNDSQALQVLNNLPAASFNSVSDLASLLVKNKNLIDLIDANGKVDKTKMGELLSGLSDIKQRPDGSIESAVFVDADGNETILTFDKKGALINADSEVIEVAPPESAGYILVPENVKYSNPALNKYILPETKVHVSQAEYVAGLAENKYFDYGEWAQFKADGPDIHGPWKMHIYADSVEDFQDMANVVLPYLRDNNVTHKVIGSEWDIADMMTTDQAGKVFTIYPSSVEAMEQISRDLDYIIKANKLTKEGSEIVGDNMLGDSGRLFYRYEYKSGKYADLYMNLDDYTIPDEIMAKLGDDIKPFANKDVSKLYHDGLYEANRGGNNYLAADMSIEDDIWRNFDPSLPANASRLAGTPVLSIPHKVLTTFDSDSIAKMSTLKNGQTTVLQQDGVIYTFRNSNGKISIAESVELKPGETHTVFADGYKYNFVNVNGNIQVASKYAAGFDMLKSPAEIQELTRAIDSGKIKTWQEALDAGYTPADIYTSSKALDIIDYSNPQQLTDYFTLKLYDEMNIKTPSDISKLADEVIAKTGCSKDEALQAIATLTQFSSFSQMDNLGKGLSDLGISSLIDTGDGTSVNNALRYLTSKKHQFILNPTSGISSPILPSGAPVSGLILDDAGLGWLKKQKILDVDPNTGLIKYEVGSIDAMGNISLQSRYVRIVNVDGWNIPNGEGLFDSISFLGSSVPDKNLADFVSSYINGGSAAPRYISDLNKLLSRKLGHQVDFNPTVITNPHFKTHSISEDTIAELMRPNMSPEYMQALFELLPQEAINNTAYFSGNAAQVMEKLVHYLDDTSSFLDVTNSSTLYRNMYSNLDPNSPGIVQQIDKWIKEGKLPEDFSMEKDVVYYVPHADKSYSVVVQQFATVNHIDPRQIIGSNYTGNLNDKVVVLLDDIVGSGDSLIDTSKYYLVKDLPIIFCPLSTLKQGELKISSSPDVIKRHNGMFAIVSGTRVDVSDQYKTQDIAFVLGSTGYKSGYAATFPQYMLPDNNTGFSDLFGYQFVTNPYSIKSYDNKFGIYDEMKSVTPGSILWKILQRAQELGMIDKHIYDSAYP